MRRKSFSLAIVLKALLIPIILVGVLPSPLTAQRTDVVILTDGSKIIGEISKLERGLLEFKTDHISTISIRWKHIAFISTKHQMDIEDVTGTRYIGSIEMAEEEGKMTIRVGEFRHSLNLQSVVIIYPLRENFWKRLQGYLDVGLNLQSANRKTDWKLGGEVSYRGKRWLTRLTTQSYFTVQEGVEGTTRNKADLVVQRILKNRWVAAGGTTHEQNSELNLDYRALFGGGFGRFLVLTNRHLLIAYIGVSATREKYSDAAEIEYNAEAMISARYEAYKHYSPKFNIITELIVFPSMTSWGRVRTDFAVRISYELFRDFFVTLDGFYNYNSAPPGELAVKHDYGIDTSLTWRFN